MDECMNGALLHFCARGNCAGDDSEEHYAPGAGFEMRAPTLSRL